MYFIFLHLIYVELFFNFNFGTIMSSFFNLDVYFIYMTKTMLFQKSIMNPFFSSNSSIFSNIIFTKVDYNMNN
jgi:hypothetical protein